MLFPQKLSLRSKLLFYSNCIVVFVVISFFRFQWQTKHYFTFWCQTVKPKNGFSPFSHFDLTRKLVRGEESSLQSPKQT
jgi:hypothetical protein